MGPEAAHVNAELLRKAPHHLTMLGVEPEGDPPPPQSCTGNDNRGWAGQGRGCRRPRCSYKEEHLSGVLKDKRKSRRHSDEKEAKELWAEVLA